VIDTNISEALLSVNDIVVGSDEEQAFVKTIKSSFPNSELTLYTRHLSENMRNKVGMNEKATKQVYVVDEIFDDNGLIEADATVEFTKQVNIIESKYQLQDYFLVNFVNHAICQASNPDSTLKYD
jgi:hypothetical protein